MEFQEIMNYPLLNLGLSQIFLNEDKVEAVKKWFRSDDMSIFQPLRVHDYGNGKYTIIDGHSRAYVAYTKGLEVVPIIYDKTDMVAGETGQKLYLADIEWCDRFHIKNISDLEKRIISGEQYRRLWMGRCDRSYDLLTQTTESERKIMQQKAPKLFLYGAEEDLSELYFEDSSGKLYVYRNDVLNAEYGD